MRFPFHNQMKISQKIIILCVFFTLINVAVADKNVIVGFNKPIGLAEKALVQSHGGVIKNTYHLIPAIATRISETNITKLKKDSRILYIENDSVYQAADEYTSSWGVQYIGGDIVSNSGITGKGIKIAVLDSGIDCNHEDLKNNCNTGYNFVNNNNNTFDDYGHGTHVSGIIAAEKNGIGIVGVAPDASLYAVKVLDRYGFTYASAIISGIQWAVDNHMDIATMSIQGPYSQSLQAVVDNAYGSGMLLVASAGNTNGNAVTYPAAYDSVIAVTAIDENGQRASFSAIGPKIELAAPGVNINSTIFGGYGLLNGTSMAAPYVTGVASLIMSKDYPDINGDGVKNNTDVRIIMQNSARDIGDQGKDNIYGYGVVDASNATLGFPNRIILTRTKGASNNDLKRINLNQGKYLLNIHSNNLSEVEMRVYENDVIRKDLSTVYKFNKSKDIYLDLNITNILEFNFIPHGSKGSTGYVKISSH